MSGLNLSAKEADHMFSLNLLFEWLSGLSGSTEYQEEVSKIVRVIIAGKNKKNEYFMVFTFFLIFVTF